MPDGSDDPDDKALLESEPALELLLMSDSKGTENSSSL